MNISEERKDIFAALARFQGEIKNVSATSNNPFFKSKYAKLNEIIDAVKEPLSKNGLAVTQTPCSDSVENIGVITVLTHETGQYIEFDPFYFRLDKIDAQKAGSAITYARRYSLAAVLGIAPDDDDDGNKASEKSSKPVARPKPVKTGVICPECQKDVQPINKNGEIIDATQVLEKLGCCHECYKKIQAVRNNA